MKGEIPYRAAGTFAGPSYVEREADRRLRDAIQQNRRYPYVVAPRQSGKSSLLVRARGALDPARFTSAFVDLSTFDITNYDLFWRSILDEIAVGAKLDAGVINPRRPEDTFHAWLDVSPARLVVFIDEIDTLIGATFCDQFFSKLRSLFNKRAEDPKLGRLMIVLAGAAHPTRLIKDHMRSPFNVGIEITLDDLTLKRATELVSHLGGSGATVSEGVAERLSLTTGGSVYLSQLLLERLWTAGEESGSIVPADVDAAVEAVVEVAGTEVHFRNIYQLVANNARLLEAFGKLREGHPIDTVAAQDLRLAGITDGVTPYRNEVYRRVFGEGGPLDLVALGKVDELDAVLLQPEATWDERETPVSFDDGMMHSLLASPDLHLSESEPPVAQAAAPSVAGTLGPVLERKMALERAGLPTRGVDAEILVLKNKMREGGQLRAGDSLGDGRFLLRRQIGRGGSGVVWQADDNGAKCEVAIKILDPNVAANEEALRRFFRGVRAMSELDHPAIVQILQRHSEDDGWHYFVMELASGGDLSYAVRAGAITNAGAPRIVLRVGDALSYAHAKGILHGDIKPYNILLTAAGHPKLTGFELAGDKASLSGRQTTTVGTLLFLAPEMIEYLAPELIEDGFGIDARADVYGLGMTALFCLSNGALSLGDLRNMKQFVFRLPCSEPLKRVLLRATEWRREARYDSVAEFCAALRGVIADEADQASGPKR